MDLNILNQRARAFDYLFDAVVVTDVQGIITDWNKGSENLYGYSKKEVIGKPVSILHVPEDVEHITSEVIASVEKHGKWSGEVRMLHKDGHIGWIESMCVPITDEGNQMVGALGINRDITKRKELENEKNELINSLQDSLNEVKTLRGIIPICSYCHSIRDDEGAWDKLEKYLSLHSHAEFSHGVCPNCEPKLRKEFGLDKNKT